VLDHGVADLAVDSSVPIVGAGELCEAGIGDYHASCESGLICCPDCEPLDNPSYCRIACPDCRPNLTRACGGIFDCWFNQAGAPSSCELGKSQAAKDAFRKLSSCWETT